MKSNKLVVTICFCLLALSLFFYGIYCYAASDTHTDETGSVHDCIDPVVGAINPK